MRVAVAVVLMRLAVKLLALVVLEVVALGVEVLVVQFQLMAQPIEAVARVVVVVQTHTRLAQRAVLV
jgi:hypothetical protein